MIAMASELEVIEFECVADPVRVDGDDLGKCSVGIVGVAVVEIPDDVGVMRAAVLGEGFGFSY